MGEGAEGGHSLAGRAFIGIISLESISCYGLNFSMLIHFHLEILLILVYLKEITQHRFIAE